MSPVLGYFVGAGYMYEVSSKFGIDARANVIFYPLKDEGLLDMDAMILSLELSLIIF